MPTITHEGNPRSTPALAVVGTLDGSVTLNVGFPVADIRGNPVILAADTLTRGSGTCPDIFDGIIYSCLTSPLDLPRYDNNDDDRGGNGILTADGTGQGAVNLLTVNTNKACYGFQYRNNPDILDYALTPSQWASEGSKKSGNMNIRARILSYEGSPVVGVMAYVDPESTIDQCTMWGVVGYAEDSTWELRYWLNEPLVAEGLPGGTLVANGAFQDGFTLATENQIVVSTSPTSGVPTPIIDIVMGGFGAEYINGAIPAGLFTNGASGIIAFPSQVESTVIYDLVIIAISA